MHLILLSGGSGKRLWPLSNEVRSKQFLKLLEGPNGKMESMVQRVYRQLCATGNWESITVVAGASQRDQIELQLGHDVNLVIEPERRDTFPAIVLAATYLYSEKGLSKDECIAVLPVDPYVEEEYFKKVAEIENELKRSNADLVLLGAAPIFASEKYGYIVPEVNQKSKYSYAVSYFKEKPDRELAEVLISQGALWNCGVFGVRLEYILNILKTKYAVRDFAYENMKKMVLSLNKTSFDYEVVEKAKNIKVIKYSGKWKDLGTWETFTEEIKEAGTGNTIIDESCKGSHVINEQELPVVAMGLTDVVVVASHDGILVASKGQTYKVKDILSTIKIRPMYEEKRWGRYTVIEHSFYENGDEALTKKLFLTKGQQISYQYHLHRKEIWSIIRGKGTVYLNGEKRAVNVGDVISLREMDKHGILAMTDLEIIEVQIGSPLIEEDIVRLEYDWS